MAKNGDDGEKAGGLRGLDGGEQLLEREAVSRMLKAQIVQVGGYLGSARRCARRCDHGEKAAREERGKDL